MALKFVGRIGAVLIGLYLTLMGVLSFFGVLIGAIMNFGLFGTGIYGVLGVIIMFVVSAFLTFVGIGLILLGFNS